MNFFHTYWSKPETSRRWDVDYNRHIESTIYFYSLSIAFIKRFGYTIDLYTDSKGKETLGHLPYDNIYIVLDNMDNVPECNWAAGKIESLKYANLGDIYIDGDVFIKRESCIDIIRKANQYDAFFQGHESIEQLPDEDSEYIYYGDNELLKDFDFPMGIPKFGKDAYNAGVIIFNNQIYKDEFIKAYEYVLKQVMDDKFINTIYKMNGCYCLDVIMEQRFLYEIGKSYKVGTLLDYWKAVDKNADDYKSINDQANELGFQHVLGFKKYEREEIEKCKGALKKVNLQIYEDAENKVNMLLK
jgi:hypothetical protein